jgi:glucose-1-phosphate thymidylyltransferase
MKGIILAGGTGSRLFPLTKVTNKHLLPVGEEPMLLHPVRKLVEAGVTKILIVTGTEHMGDVVGLLGSGREYGAEFTFRVQDEAGGIAQALALGENFAGDDRICVLLGDNIFADGLGDDVAAFEAQEAGARVFLKSVPDPGRYGVARVDGDKVTEIIEKPKDPPSDLAVTGIYFYDSEVFDIIRGLKPSARGEYEITDVNNAYIARGTMSFGRMKGWWTDAGTFPSYHLANKLVRGEETGDE